MKRQEENEEDLSIHNSSKKQQRLQRIVILGSGFSGIKVLKSLQKKFHNNKEVTITLVSKDNFLLFTPMLPEVASGMIETRHIVTPVRTFCKKAKFYQANVESIDLENKKVVIKHSIGKHRRPTAWDQHILEYDYLVIALGSETNFFGMADVEKNSFTMKSIGDAIILRNHILDMLEQASIEEQGNNAQLTKSLLTFVVVGGGFNGVETVGELNDFIRYTIRGYYKNINMANVNIILVNDRNRILEEVHEDLGRWAMQKLKIRGVRFIMNRQIKGISPTSTKLDNGDTLYTYTVVWSTGVTPSELIANLPCDHDKGQRITTNQFLEVPKYPGVYAVGDCASITDPHTGKPYPPTAQHAIRQGKVAAKNIIYSINAKNRGKENKKKKEEKKEKFDYKTKGMMAEIGKRTGVATLFGFKIHGFIAWWLWRTFYLANLPTIKKKLKVMSDWTMDLFFKPDVAMIKRMEEVESKRYSEDERRR